MSNTDIRARFLLRRPAPRGRQAFVLDVDVTLPGRGVTAIFGQSGSGKSTFLRCIAGLERPEPGELEVLGERWQSARLFLPAHRRPLGYVFQEASLFPHLSAQGNLDYAKRRADVREDSQFTQDQVVELLGIGHCLQQLPHELSGGERQRVAIARALLIQPRLLLMDEPMASLDDQRKAEILPYLERLRDEIALPILYVSHSVAEVSRLAHHLVVLDQGAVKTQGPLTQVLAGIDPPLPLGEDSGVVLEATVAARDPRWHLVRVRFAGGELWVRDEGDVVGQPVRVRILARDISLTLQEQRDSSIANRIQGEVIALAEDTHPAMCLVQLQIGPSTLLARITQRSADQLDITPGRCVWVQIKSVALVR
ncbi:MAG: molybdenum ABC transporter ATP-binding protein [Cellvibrionaceae bacterium]|nr:molybdenum ABC transporter ATP-binding protein [Cellvibrionaceae bacterium]